MTWAPWVLAAVPLAIWFIHLVEARLTGWKGRRLADLPADGPGPLPSLTVAVPALNEEDTIEPAMRTLLALDYPGVEIVAVDDRSTDGTGAILDRLAASDPRLRVIHVRELPAGWIGKNHALHVASLEARGEYILFTDADVHFEPDALKRALRAASGSKLDHLTVFPDLLAPGFWESISVWFFGVVLAMHTRPWRVADPRSRAFTGIGAFNLVRASAYRAMGGHASLPMEVVDDIKLGKRMKWSGGRSEPVFGAGMVRVRWVVGVGGMIRGMTKNAFAGFGFRILPALSAVAGQTYIVFWPYAGLFIGPWGARALCGGAILSMVLLAAPARPAPGLSPLRILLFPVASMVLSVIILRSMAVTLWQGGVRWRGTLYPLRELRKGVV